MALTDFVGRRGRGVAAWALPLALLGHACDSGVPSCPRGTTSEGGECVAPLSIALNSVGFRPEDPKLASVATEVDQVYLRGAQDDELRLVLSPAPAQQNVDTGETLWTLDFTELDAPGEYYLEAEAAGRSAEFEVASNVYAGPLRTSLLGLYGQRCGAPVALEHGSEHYAHDACHALDEEAASIAAAGAPRDASGGWHDAGDYGKYVVNGAFSVAFLLLAYDFFGARLDSIRYLPEADARLPDILAEANFELTWLLKMQREDGAVLHQLRALEYEPIVSPDADRSVRWLSEPSSAATADFSAVMALAARVLAPLDSQRAEEALAAASSARAWLVEHPELVQANHEAWPNSTYGDRTDADERLWADVEYWRATSDPESLARAEAGLAELTDVPVVWDWQGTANLGVLGYLTSEDSARDDELRASLEERVVASARALVDDAEADGYGRGVDAYFWGSNGIVARSCVNLALAARLTQDPRFVSAGALQVGHLLGRNFFARSQVTGVGYRPPLAPHHRPSQTDRVAAPWPGLLVGGANAGSSDNPSLSPDQPPGTAWFDSSQDYWTNEVAVNWNTAMVFALSALLNE